MLTDVFNACLKNGTFPARWKQAHLSLLSKPGKPESIPSSYRALCLLDDIKKILDSLLVGRMKAHMYGLGIRLSERQYGFRNGRSTDDALRIVHEHFVDACGARRKAVAVSLGIRNAFNMVGRDVVRATLERTDFPLKHRRILQLYLGEGVLHLCDDNQGDTVTMDVTCEVSQGPYSAALHWNITYDAVFRLRLPSEATSIGYATDTIFVVEGDTVKAVRIVPEVLGYYAQMQRNDVRYEKSQWVMAALRGLMPKVGGPREGRRHLNVSVVESVLLYGAPTWGPFLVRDQRA